MKGKRVLIGFDGSEGAKDAVELARIFCDESAASALLVNVLPYPEALPVAYRLLGYDESPAWKHFFREAEEELGGIDAMNRTYAGGSAAKVLTDVSEKEPFDLIVVGSPHLGAVGRALIGSSAQGLLHGAPAPIAVAPHGYAKERHDAFQRIAVGYDGSPEADAAVDRAEEFAVANGGTIEIMTVASPPMVPPGPFAGPLPPLIPDPVEVMNRGVNSVAPGIEVHGHELHGDAAHQIARACKGMDLLIVGSRGYGPLARVMLGSVSTELINLASCPVLVLPRPEKHSDSDHDGALAEARA